jgi:hypothetical protein
MGEALAGRERDRQEIEDLRRQMAALQARLKDLESPEHETAPVLSIVDDIGDPAPVEVAAPAEPPQPTAAAESPAVSAPQDDFAHGFPWEEGDPPLAVELAGQGRLAEAYWVTAMLGEPDRRAGVLRFAAASYAVHNNAEATSVLAALDFDVQELAKDMDAAILATTAILRAGLVAGWGHPLLAQLRPELTLSEPAEMLVDACIAAVRRDFRIDYGVGVLPPEDDVHEARNELGRRAANLSYDLPRRKNNYQRATRVLQRLTLPEQPLSSALQAVIAWSKGSGTGKAIAAALATLDAQDATDSLIEAADAAMRTPKQAREPIVAGALRGLQRAIDEVRVIVHEADVLNRRLTVAQSDDGDVVEQLQHAVARVGAADPQPGMAGAAISLLHRWLTSPSGKITFGYAANDEPGQIEPAKEVLLPLPDLPMDAAGRPDPDDPRARAVLAELARPLDLGAAISQYCARGDLRNARRVIDLAAEGFWPVAPAPTASETFAAAQEEWTQRHRAALTRIRDLFARVRTQNLLDQAEETTVAGRLEALKDVRDGAFDEAAVRLSELAADLEATQRRRIDELRTELESPTVAGPDRARILALLDDGDTVTAAEFLAFVREGKDLPQQHEQTAQDVKAFTELLEKGAAAGLKGPQVGARQWAELAADGNELTALGGNGAEAWDSLGDARQHAGDKLPTAIRDILHTLGLNCTAKPREANARTRQGFRKFRVRGAPSDGSYVSVLGSAATDYTVTLVVEERRGRSVLDVLSNEDAGRANIVLYLHSMDLPARWSLAGQSVSSQVQALVVDRAVFGWVAATAPGSWRATQRITLPWTALNPYTPFVAGLVPPEVFVGRTREMAEVVDPNGGLFIYGGRQLGKSALLRRVEATFNSGDRQHAIYLDLKGRGIGEAEPATRIWRELVVELKERGVLAPKVLEDASPDDVVKNVRAWLNGQPGRRLLLLADEADAFLTADSRGVPSPGGVAHFPNVLRLKELMESTERRFKVVFAGLHQVQRFGHLSNVPLAHGGPDILVGPLDPQDARRLVVGPMAALGYSFERPELVWRLLAATNYQASLIQIFCDELMRTLHKRLSHTQALPVLIRESDVEAVAASDRVRDRIAERLRITINLEDRYRVLTLIIALRSLEDAFGSDYGPEELLEYARKHWPAGFDDLTASQVNIYLSEMVGLGLLIRLSGQNRYAVRSPNVVNMLGTKADFVRELGETDFDLPYEYNPRDARRLLAVDDRKADRRSPLTDGQLSELSETKRVNVVTGTAALGIERLTDSIRDYAEMRGSRVDLFTSGAEVTKGLQTATRRTRSTVVVADLRDKPLAEVSAAGKRLMGAGLASVMLVEPAVAKEVAEQLGTEPARPTRWTTGSLRSWPECPFDVPEARKRLIDATGGWPELVEDLIAMVMRRGATQAQAIGRVLQGAGDAVWAWEFLSQAGVGEALAERIGPWADYFDPGEAVAPADVAAALEMDVPQAGDLLAELANLGVLDEETDGVALDRMVHRCLSTVRGGS